MKYADIARAALVLALGMMTSAVLAQTPIYSEAFEAISTETNLLNASVTPPSWTGGADDISAVVAGTPDEPTVGYPLPAAGHTKVLQLNTEGGTLTNTLSSLASFESENVYVDSMVKFVPSEDLASFDDLGIKVALYAYISENGENVSTNLAIYHGGFNGEGYLFTTNTVADLPVDASAWYRLTILLANDESLNKGNLGSQAVQIYINGVLLTNDNAYAGEAWTDVTEEDLLNGPGNGTWFVSASNLSETQKVVETLQFKGTGFVDDLVVGTGDPFTQGEPPAAPFGITQDIGDHGGANDESALIVVQAGSSTTLVYTADEFYRIATLTTNGTAIGAAADAEAYELVLSATNDVAVTFAAINSLSDATITWFTGNGWGEGDVVPGLDYANLEMLNVAATNAAAGGTITIEAIEVVGDDVKVTVFIDRTMSLGADIVGTLKLYGATTLEGGFTEIGSGVTIGADQDGSQDDIRKEITYVAAGGKKFYKAVIE